MSVTYSEPGIFNVLDPWVDVLGVGYTAMIANSTGDAAQNTEVLLGIIQLAQAYADGECPTGMASTPQLLAVCLAPRIISKLTCANSYRRCYLRWYPCTKPSPPRATADLQPWRARRRAQRRWEGRARAPDRSLLRQFPALGGWLP